MANGKRERRGQEEEWRTGKGEQEGRETQRGRKCGLGSAWDETLLIPSAELVPAHPSPPR